MKADLTRQWRLLDLQKLDTRLDQLSHRERSLPVFAELSAAESRRASLDEEVVLARVAVEDVEREITKADNDVQLVRDRAARDRSRLDAGQGSAKELQGLQHELDTLTRRQAELEDVELEVMERAEGLRADLTARETALATAAADIERLAGERDKSLTDVAAERVQVHADRESIAPGIGEELLALYEKIRAQVGGIAAAPLAQRRCGGCGMELNSSELAQVRAADENEVIRHEECRRILVRTAESGL